MPRICSVCTHPDHESIDKSLRNGLKSTYSIAEEYGLQQGAVSRHKLKHLTPRDITDAALTAPPLDIVPRDPQRPGRLTAYQDLEALRDKAIALIDRIECATIEDGKKKEASTYELATAYGALRETIKTQVQVYEAQRRIEAQYNPPESIHGSFIFQWLRINYPTVLQDLVAAARKEAEKVSAT